LNVTVFSDIIIHVNKNKRRTPTKAPPFIIEHDKERTPPIFLDYTTQAGKSQGGKNMQTNIRSAVCRIANTLVKNGFTRSEAMRQAWALAKLPNITTKVAGTASQPIRQTALEHLTKYNPADISFKLTAEPTNAHDPHAVAVIVTVKDKGFFKIGYLPRTLAANIAPLLSSGINLYTTGCVTGGYEPYINYGAKVNIAFA